MRCLGFAYIAQAEDEIVFTPVLENPITPVKNSWGNTGDYHSIWYMSKAYIALNTTYIFINKAAVKKDARKKLGF